MLETQYICIGDSVLANWCDTIGDTVLLVTVAQSDRVHRHSLLADVHAECDSYIDDTARRRAECDSVLVTL